MPSLVSRRSLRYVLIVTCLGLASAAQAQMSTDETEPSNAPAENAGNTKESNARAAAEPLTPGEVKVATPSPNAPPEKVKAAEETAEAAKVTPIVPSPQNPFRPAFQLYAEFDIPVLSIGLVFAGARLIRSQSAYCAPLCKRGELNALDDLTAGTWSPRWQRASDVALYTLMLGSATMLFVEEGALSGLNDLVVIAESALAATALASILTLAASRPRPFVYGEKAPLSERRSANGSLSFLSSHAAVAFAIATSSYMTSRRLHPRSNTSRWVLGVGGAMAAFIATARVFGGMHFITDAIGGAMVGASTGVLVPALHGSPVSVVPVAGASQKGLALVAQF